MNVVEKALADHVQPKGFLAQLKEAGASSMEPEEYVKQFDSTKSRDANRQE